MRITTKLFAVYSLAILAATTVAPTAAAHPVSYVAGIYVAVDVAVDPATGTGFITIADDIFFLAVGDYCQDNNNDNLCGGIGDYGGDFCGSVFLMWGVNWDPTIPTQARVHPFDLNLCGAPTFGSTGVFVHS